MWLAIIIFVFSVRLIQSFCLIKLLVVPKSLVVLALAIVAIANEDNWK
jgi:hypothetical protein